MLAQEGWKGVVHLSIATLLNVGDYAGSQTLLEELGRNGGKQGIGKEEPCTSSVMALR